MDVRQKMRPGTGLTVLVFASVVVLNIGLWRGDGSFEDYFELRQSRRVLSERVEKLSKENEKLSKEITRLKGSPSYARKVLRDRYHITEPNEDIVFLAE